MHTVSGRCWFDRLVANLETVLNSANDRKFLTEHFPKVPSNIGKLRTYLHSAYGLSSGKDTFLILALGRGKTLLLYPVACWHNVISRRAALISLLRSGIS